MRLSIRGPIDQPTILREWRSSTARSILAKEPDDAAARKLALNAHVGRARAFTRLGRTAEALAEWDTAAKTQPDPARAEQIAMGRAVTLAGSGAFAEAMEALNRLGEPRALEEETAQTAVARV